MSVYHRKRGLEITLLLAVSFFMAFTVVTACKRKEKEVAPIDVPQPPNPSISKPVQPAPAPEGPPNLPGNLLKNAGFEEGREGWVWLDWSQYWVDFDISGKKAHSGKKSAYLKLNAKKGSPEVEIHGVMQTLSPSRFPDVAGGYYRVENWKRGSAVQYMQFVVIIWGGNPNLKNYQIRYILTGVHRAPMSMRNVRYIIGKEIKDEPVQKEWVHFEFPIRQDFIKQWGRAPTGYEKINFFFEARYDKEPGEGQQVRADVYYDDLYVGDASAAP